ncbi:MAG: PLP-dependent aminotransferase family protein [Hyphomicrobiaceae bacterium]|nr:PLP-dependent aminotransferase family protein [Hyphomicrobiaceae bacterium]
MAAVDRQATRIASVMSMIQQRIAARSLTYGEKLPSIRMTAANMGVSTSTVVDAYDRLVADGLIQSRPGSGFYVAANNAPLSLADMCTSSTREVDPLWVSRQSLEAADGVIRPGCGWLPETWLPQDSLRSALRALARADNSCLAEYGTPQGSPALREFLARRMGERGINAPSNRILLAESATHAVDLLCRFLIEPGDTVLVDDPCYFNFHALLRAHRAKVVGVPYTRSGPDITSFERVLLEDKPRVYITNSGLHNPTGATLSPVTAHQILKLAEAANVTIIEDDIFADFEHSIAPRLAAFDGLQRVVHIGSFSKTLSASIRCGFIAARADWIEGLIDLKIATSFGGARLNAEVLLHTLRDGSYRKHMHRLRQRLSATRSAVSRQLKSVGIEPWLEPEAGMFLWCKLPDEVDATELAKAALAHDIVLAPGNVFSLSQSAKSFMRFNVSQSQDKRMIDFLRRQSTRW